MLETIFYILITTGFLGMITIFLNIEIPKLEKKYRNYISLSLFINGLIGTFWLGDIQIATCLTAIIAIVLGGYIALARPGLLSIKAVKGGISLSLFLFALMIIEMPSHYLLPIAGHLTIFEKIIFVLLAFHSIIAFVGSFPLKKISKINFPMPYYIFYGLKFLTLSVVVLFLTTESPTGILLIGISTLVLMLFFRTILIKNDIQMKIYEKSSNMAFTFQFIWVSILLNYVPLLIISGIFSMIFLSKKSNWINLKNEIIFTKLK